MFLLRLNSAFNRLISLVFLLYLIGGGTIFTLVALVARADTVIAGTSSHASTRAGLLTNSCAVFNWVGAVNSTSITRNADVTLLVASNGFSANAEGQLSTAAASTARILEAESGLRAGTLGVKGSLEALRSGSSTKALETGESSIGISINIITIITLRRVNPLAVIRSTVSRARTTTSSGLSTASSGSRAELTEFRGRAGTSEERTTLALTPVVGISITIVVRNEPTSRFKDSKGEFGNLHLGDETGSHSFVSELSSFEVRSGSSRRSGILHVSSLERRATEMLSKSASEGLSIDNASSHTIKTGRSNVSGEGFTATSEPVSIQSLTETKSVDNFMYNADHLSFVIHGFSSGSEEFSTDDSLTNDGSLGT